MELDLDRAAYIALLPTVWSILCQECAAGGAGAAEVLIALIDHATRLSSTNGVKGAATEFVARLVLVSVISAIVCEVAD
jgi:pre-rRNA-processing protein IPI1